jgi:hypothetical protein
VGGVISAPAALGESGGEAGGGCAPGGRQSEEGPSFKRDKGGGCGWGVGGGGGSQQQPDVIVVGLQEVVKLTGKALTVRVDSAESRAWLHALSSAIGAPGAYTVLVSRQYVGIYLFVAARTELVECSVVREAQSKATGCGIMGQFGNKGAVSVRMVVYNASICLVCSHLAAGVVFCVLCVCVCVCSCVRVFVCSCVRVFVCVCSCVCVRVFVCVRVCVDV